MLRRFYRRHSGATTDRLVSDGSYPSIVCIASARAVPPVGQYRITLPHERLLAEEIARTGRQLDLQRQKEFRALPRSRRPPPSRSRRAFRQGHHLIAEGGRRLGGASQIAAAAEFRDRPRHPCARRLTNVPFCRPGDVLFQFIVRRVRRESGTSGVGPLTDQWVTRRAVHRFHVPELGQTVDTPAVAAMMLRVAA